MNNDGHRDKKFNIINILITIILVIASIVSTAWYIKDYGVTEGALTIKLNQVEKEVEILRKKIDQIEKNIRGNTSKPTEVSRNFANLIETDKLNGFWLGNQTNKHHTIIFKQTENIITANLPEFDMIFDECNYKLHSSEIEIDCQFIKEPYFLGFYMSNNTLRVYKDAKWIDLKKDQLN